MAQLGVQYPSLEGLMGGMGGYATGQRMDIAKQNESINQAQALQDIFQQQQMDPVRLRQAGLNADTTEAQLGGVKADVWQKERNNQVRQGISLDQEQRAQLSNMAAQMSEDDWKQEENAINRALISPDRAVREQVAQLLPLFKEFQMERLKNADRAERDQSVEAIKGRNAKELMQMQIDAGRFKKSDQGVKGIQDQLTSGKLNFEKAAVLLQNASVMAEMEGDAETAMRYRTMASEYAAKNEAAKQAMGGVPKAGSVDIGRLPGANIPTVPERPTVPFQSPTSAAPQSGTNYQTWTMQQWQQRYPNVPEAALRAKLKEKGFTPK